MGDGRQGVRFGRVIGEGKLLDHSDPEAGWHPEMKSVAISGRPVFRKDDGDFLRFGKQGIRSPPVLIDGVQAQPNCRGLADDHP